MKQEIGMSKIELRDLFEYYKNNLKREYIQIDIMFVQKTTNKNNIYKTYMLACKNNDIDEVLFETIKNMDNIVSERTIDKYDLEVSVDETLQVVKSEKVDNFRILEEALTIDYTPNNTINDNTDYNKFDFIYVQLSDNNENPRLPITIIKKHLRAPAKLRGAKSFVFNGCEAKAYDKKLLIIGDNVDAFLVGDDFYVVNRNNFNSFMNFKDIYYRIINDNMNDILNSELFDKTEEFVEDCKNNGHFVTRLTKAILAGGFKNMQENKAKLNILKEEFKLKLDFTEDGKIIYKKEQVDEILNLLLELYVTSALTDTKMLALAVEKYE